MRSHTILSDHYVKGLKFWSEFVHFDDHLNLFWPFVSSVSLHGHVIYAHAQWDLIQTGVILLKVT